MIENSNKKKRTPLISKSNDKVTKQNLNQTNTMESHIDSDKSIDPNFSWLRLYKQVSFLGFQAFFIYLVTFTLYPGTFLATKFDFLDNNSSRKSWFDILMVTICAVIDFIGR